MLEEIEVYVLMRHLHDDFMLFLFIPMYMIMVQRYKINSYTRIKV